MPRHPRVWLLLAVALCAPPGAGAYVTPRSSQPAPAAGDLFVRVGLSADEAAQARAGRAAVRVLPPNTSTEIAAAGAIRIRGDLERLVVWLRDIESFRRPAQRTSA